MTLLREIWNSYICDSRGCYLVNDPEITFQDHEEAEAYCDEHNRALPGQAAAEERAKIVAWLRDDADQVVNADNLVSCADIIAEAIVECAIAIEAGEHLK